MGGGVYKMKSYKKGKNAPSPLELNETHSTKKKKRKKK